MASLLLHHVLGGVHLGLTAGFYGLHHRLRLMLGVLSCQFSQCQHGIPTGVELHGYLAHSVLTELVEIHQLALGLEDVNRYHNDEE